MVLLSKGHKKTQSQLISKTDKMTDFHINEISNILHGESWEYLHALNTNQSFNIFHNRLIEILDLASQDMMVRISAKHKIKDSWGLLFCVNLLKNCLNFVINIFGRRL